MPRLARCGALFFAGFLALAAASPAFAQETSDTGLPVTPDPAECTVAPVTIEDVLARGDAMMDSSAAASPIAAAGAEEFTLPEGEPADPAVVDAITATTRDLLACLNTGDFLVIFKLTTDRFLIDVLSEEMDMADEDMAMATPETELPMGTPLALTPEQYATLVAIHEVTILADGRAGALVETIFPPEMPEVQVDYLIFAEEDGRWLLDEIIEDLEAQFPPASATPTP